MLALSVSAYQPTEMNDTTAILNDNTNSIILNPTSANPSGQSNNTTNTNLSNSQPNRISSKEVRQKLKERLLNKHNQNTHNNNNNNNNNNITSTNTTISPQASCDSEENSEENFYNRFQQHPQHYFEDAAASQQNYNLSIKNNVPTVTRSNYPIRKTNSLPNLKVNRSVRKQFVLDKRPSPLTKRPSPLTKRPNNSHHKLSTNLNSPTTTVAPSTTQNPSLFVNNQSTNTGFFSTNPYFNQLQQSINQSNQYPLLTNNLDNSQINMINNNNNNTNNSNSNINNNNNTNNNSACASAYNLPLQALFNSSQPQLIPPFSSLPNLNISDSFTALLSANALSNLHSDQSNALMDITKTINALSKASLPSPNLNIPPSMQIPTNFLYDSPRKHNISPLSINSSGLANYKIRNRKLNRTNSAPLPLGNNNNNNNNINPTSCNLNSTTPLTTSTASQHHNSVINQTINLNNNSPVNLQQALQEQKSLALKSQLRNIVLNRHINNHNHHQSFNPTKPTTNSNMDTIDKRKIMCTRTLSDSLINSNGRLPHRSLSLDEQWEILANQNPLKSQINQSTLINHNNDHNNHNNSNNSKCSNQEIRDLCLLSHQRIVQQQQQQQQNQQQQNKNSKNELLLDERCDEINLNNNSINNCITGSSFRKFNHSTGTTGFPLQDPNNNNPINKLPSPILEEKTVEYSHTTAIAYDVGMLNHRCLCGNEDNHPESSRRLSSIWERLNMTQIVDKCQIIPGKKASMDDLQLCHQDTYSVLFGANPANRLKINPELLMSVDFCRLPCGGIGVDSDTIWNNVHTANAARLAVGCVIELTMKVIRKELRNGFALVRPPGHHAEFSQAMGFAYFNSVAIAAKKVVQETSLSRVAIIDWDIHHGNGTQQVFYSDNSVLYISMHRHDSGNFFPGTGSVNEIGEGEGLHYNINIPWCSTINNMTNDSVNIINCSTNFDFSVVPVSDAEYIAAFVHIIMPILGEFQPELILVSAGYDATEQHQNQLGGYSVSSGCFGWMTQQLANSGLADGRVVLALEGGFHIGSLCDCVEACMWSLIKPDKIDFINPRNDSLNDKFLINSKEQQRAPLESAVETLNSVVQIHKNKWQCLRQTTKQQLSQTIAQISLLRHNNNQHRHHDNSIPLVAMAELTVQHYNQVQHPNLHNSKLVSHNHLSAIYQQQLHQHMDYDVVSPTVNVLDDDDDDESNVAIDNDNNNVSNRQQHQLRQHSSANTGHEPMDQSTN